jgi:hypothetical protein
MKTSGKNLGSANECRMEVGHTDPKKVHAGMAQANAGNGNPMPGM